MVKELRSFNDLLTMPIGDVEIVDEEIILGEIDVHNDFVYNPNTKEYGIESLEVSTLEDIYYPIIDPETFTEIEINGCRITKELFESFRELIKDIENGKKGN